jgi:glycosyltransferase involved in cell wall biosynthesis
MKSFIPSIGLSEIAILINAAAIVFMQLFPFAFLLLVIAWLRDCLIDRIHVHYVNVGAIAKQGGNWRTLFSYRLIQRILKKIQPDVFHAQYATSYGITAALVNFHPFIISGWGSDVLISPKSSKILRFLLKWAFKRADAITVVAKHMVKAVYDLGVSSEKVHVITHGINPNLFYDQKLDKQEDFTLICTRNLEPLYNHIQLIDAFEISQKKIPQLKLRILGDGSMRHELEQKVLEQKLEKQVEFIGRVSQEEMAIELNKAHVFVTVSTTDGDVVSLVEAIACGNYCIVSDIPANHNWIEEEVNGFFVPLYDAPFLAETIEKVYQDYSNKKEFGTELNRTIVESTGNWDSNMIQAEKLYLTIMQSNHNLKESV